MKPRILKLVLFYEEHKLRYPLSAICSVHLMQNICSKEIKQNAFVQDYEIMISNDVDLGFFGNQTIRILFHTLLAKSTGRYGLKLLIHKESETYVNHPLVKQTTVLGTVPFASL